MHVYARMYIRESYTYICVRLPDVYGIKTLLGTARNPVFLAYFVKIFLGAPRPPIKGDGDT